MKFTIKKQQELSGSKTSIYSVILEDGTETLLDRFVRENSLSYRNEVRELMLRLYTIGHTTGARETFFKPEEGKPGDGIEALYDTEESHLRLYCIRNGRVALIVGGGGPKQGGAWQDYPKLTEENELLQLISKTLTKAIVDPYSELKWSLDGMELQGELTIDTDDY